MIDGDPQGSRALGSVCRMVPSGAVRPLPQVG